MENRKIKQKQFCMFDKKYNSIELNKIRLLKLFYGRYKIS